MRGRWNEIENNKSRLSQTQTLPISLESGNGNCDMVEKSVSLDILSDNINKLSFADHSKVSNSLFYMWDGWDEKKKLIKINNLSSLMHC